MPCYHAIKLNGSCPKRIKQIRYFRRNFFHTPSCIIALVYMYICYNMAWLRDTSTPTHKLEGHLQTHSASHLRICRMKLNILYHLDIHAYPLIFLNLIHIFTCEQPGQQVSLPKKQSFQPRLRFSTNEKRVHEAYQYLYIQHIWITPQTGCTELHWRD